MAAVPSVGKRRLAEADGLPRRRSHRGEDAQEVDADDEGDVVLSSTVVDDESDGYPTVERLQVAAQDDEEVARTAAPEAYAILCRVWSMLLLNKQTRIAHLPLFNTEHPTTKAILTDLAGFRGVGERVRPDEFHPSVIPRVGATICLLEEVLMRRPRHHFKRALVRVMDVDGFGWCSWDDNVPRLVDEVNSAEALASGNATSPFGDIAVLLDAMVTHSGGAPYLAARTNRSFATARGEFDRGTAHLCHQGLSTAVPCPDRFEEGWAVGLSTMMSLQGPLLTTLHIRDPEVSPMGATALASFAAAAGGQSGIPHVLLCYSHAPVVHEVMTSTLRHRWTAIVGPRDDGIAIWTTGAVCVDPIDENGFLLSIST